MAKEKSRISTAVVRRLPRYYRHLEELKGAGVEHISSHALGEIMGLTASQIRQDLSCFGAFGQQGYGYHIEKLRREVAYILGMDAGHRAILLGAGNLGNALIHNFDFRNNGMELVAAFDVRCTVVGSDIAGIPVFSTQTLEAYLAATPVDVAVLTVPGNIASDMAERLVRAGVRGIWNFTNTELNITRPGVVVEDVHFADSLLAMSYYLKSRQE